MKKKSLTIILIAIALGVGFYFGRLLASDNITTNYNCGDIALFHAGLLMKKYDIHDGFNTDQNNPNRDTNQKASDLNAKLLEICTSDLTK